MPRPPKFKHIDKKPKITRFSPRGRHGRPDYIILRLEEYEALRLSDVENLKQNDAAKLMRVSRQTFGRILKNAHRSIADAIIYGKIIKIANKS